MTKLQIPAPPAIMNAGGVHMGRDMAKKAVSDARFQAKCYDRFSVKIRKDSGILQFLNEASAKSDISKNAYVIAAVVEKLQRDGYTVSED